MGGFQAGLIALMRLMPVATFNACLIGGFIKGLMQPAVPFRRHTRGFNIAIVNHPAAGFTINRGAEAIHIIAIALPVLANQLTPSFGPDKGAKGMGVPPS
jgi:hypothetical protein